MTKTFGKKRSMDGDGSIHRFKWPLELPKTLAFPICKLNRRNKESALFLLFSNGIWSICILVSSYYKEEDSSQIHAKNISGITFYSSLRRMSTVSNAIIPQTSSSKIPALKSPFVMILVQRLPIFIWKFKTTTFTHLFSSPLSSSS